MITHVLLLLGLLCGASGASVSLRFAGAASAARQGVNETSELPRLAAEPPAIARRLHIVGQVGGPLGRRAEEHAPGRERLTDDLPPAEQAGALTQQAAAASAFELGHGWQERKRDSDSPLARPAVAQAGPSARKGAVAWSAVELGQHRYELGHGGRDPPAAAAIRDLLGGGEERLHCFGLNRPQCAFVLSTLSGISLPIGAAMGVLLHPVKQETVAVLLAIGGGSLLFAVTVELYGHALHEVSEGRMDVWHEMVVIMFFALVGSWFYIWANEKVENWIKGQHDEVHDNLIEPGESTTQLHSLVRKEIHENTKNRRRALLHVASVVREQQKKVDRQRSISTCAADSEVTPRENADEEAESKALAMALFLGLLIDGVPECMLMGFLAAEERLNMVLVISLIVANFPEAFSSASLLTKAHMSHTFIVGIWTGLMLMVGALCSLSCFLLLRAFPRYGSGESDLPLYVVVFVSAIEGLAGGAMITLISAVILPEAMEKATKTGPIPLRSGFCCACGFLLSVALKLTFDDPH